MQRISSKTSHWDIKTNFYDRSVSIRWKAIRKVINAKQITAFELIAENTHAQQSKWQRSADELHGLRIWRLHMSRLYTRQGAATFPHDMRSLLLRMLALVTHLLFLPLLVVSMITSQLAMRGKVGTEGKQREGTTSGWICRAKAKAKLIEALFVFAPQAVCCRSSSNSSSSSACIQANRLI